MGVSTLAIVSLDDDDYIEAYTRFDVTGSSPVVNATYISTTSTVFGSFKIIE